MWVLSQYPNIPISAHGWRKNCTNSIMDANEVVGLAAGVLTAGSMLPQVIKSWKEKKAEDVSLVMLIVLIDGIDPVLLFGIITASKKMICP